MLAGEREVLEGGALVPEAAPTEIQAVHEHPRYPAIYTEVLAEEIVGLYLAGQTLKEICENERMPRYNTLFKWMKDNAGFKKQIKAARELRGLHFEEEALAAAKSVADEKDVGRARLEFDANKWAAEINDPATYGKKTTIQGNPDQPVQFIIHTGFPEPNEFQQPPELGADGLIKKNVAEKIIEAESSEVSSEEQPVES